MSLLSSTSAVARPETWFYRLKALAGLRPLPNPGTVPARRFNVLVICSGNSARSIIGEALLSHLGKGRVRGFSAGSRPAGRVDSLALRVLAEQGIPTRSFYSKSWLEFARPQSRKMDLVITVCEAAAEEPCPLWPGEPLALRWELPDPEAVQGTMEQRLLAFRESFALLKARVEQLLARLDASPGLDTREAEPQDAPITTH